jgi:hypothetical protein
LVRWIPPFFFRHRQAVNAGGLFCNTLSQIIQKYGQQAWPEFLLFVIGSENRISMHVLLKQFEEYWILPLVVHITKNKQIEIWKIIKLMTK